MAYKIEGTVKLIQEPQTFASGFTKRCLILTESSGKFEQFISIEFFQDKVSLLDDLAEGQSVKVTFDIRGRDCSGRYFNNLVGWKLEAGEKAQPENDRPPLPNDNADDDESDSIPF